MKKWICLLLFGLLLSLAPTFCYATESEDMQETMQEQKNNLGISDFIESAQKYSDGSWDDFNVNELLESAIKGNIDNSKIFSKILGFFGQELKTAFSMFGIILVVIIIHSVLKSVSESLNNTTISQIAYYIEYILIVTLIMSNFAQIVSMTKDTIRKFSRFFLYFNTSFNDFNDGNRKYCFSRCCTTYYFIFDYFYWKYHKYSYFTSCFNLNSN